MGKEVACGGGVAGVKARDWNEGDRRARKGGDPRLIVGEVGVRGGVGGQR